MEPKTPDPDRQRKKRSALLLFLAFVAYMVGWRYWPDYMLVIHIMAPINILLAMALLRKKRRREQGAAKVKRHPAATWQGMPIECLSCGTWWMMQWATAAPSSTLGQCVYCPNCNRRLLWPAAPKQ